MAWQRFVHKRDPSVVYEAWEVEGRYEVREVEGKRFIGKFPKEAWEENYRRLEDAQD